MIETSHRSYQTETSNAWDNSNIQSAKHCSNLSSIQLLFATGCGFPYFTIFSDTQ
jgi:hypothetical protein